MEQDRLQTQRNDILVQQQLPSMNYTLFMEEGELVAEWNRTLTVNETTYTHIYKQYKMDVNGTTQTAAKVWVYSSDGTLITDPSWYFVSYPLVYLFQFLWIWQWIHYGDDYYLYTHWNPYEAQHLISVWYDQCATIGAGMSVVSAVLTLLDIIPGVDLVSAPINLAWHAITAVTVAAMVRRIQMYSNVASHNGAWGLRTLDKAHHVWGAAPWWDTLSYLSEGAVYIEGPTEIIGVYYCLPVALGNLVQQWTYWSIFLGAVGQWVAYSLPEE